ncbi:MAG: hypothetical protein JWM99_4513 [Verrucomicrobiales bacterium]|nr:hypothetical protein [Verrucomicrobiales bacterium]
MIDNTLLEILRCPESYQTLRVADSALVQSINQKMKFNQVKNRGGQAISEPIDGGLLREDGKFLYPIRGRIPVMLVDEAIAI